MTTHFRTTARRALLAVAISTIAIPAGVMASTSVHASPSYFAFVSTNAKHQSNEFIVEVDDPATAAVFRDIVLNLRRPPRIAFTGELAATREPYNEAWAFHVIPSTLRLQEGLLPEACDGSPEYIEENIALIGHPDFLNKGVWCPWSFHLSREVLFTPDRSPAH